MIICKIWDGSAITAAKALASSTRYIKSNLIAQGNIISSDNYDELSFYEQRDIISKVLIVQSKK